MINPTKPKRCYALVVDGKMTPMCGSLKETVDLKSQQVAGFRRFEKIVPVVIADSRYFRVTRKPARGRPRKKGAGK